MKRKTGKRSESKRKLREKDTTRPCLPPGSKSQLFSCGNSWHLYFHDPDNVCLNMERLQKVKGRGSMVDVRLVIATSELSLIPERPGISVFMWWQRVPHQHTHKGFFYKNMTPLLVQRRTSPVWSYCLHANILLSILSTFVAPQGAGTS